MATKSIETQLQEVLDREAIRTLPVRYCHCVWQKDLDGYVDLFTEDGSISMNDPLLPDTKGRAALRKMIADGLDTMKPRPFIHNHVVELQGPEKATGTCYIEVRLFRDGKKWEISGWYNDEYAKVGEEWKFKSRKIIVDSSAPAGGNS